MLEFWLCRLTATHCNTLQHTPTHCDTLRHTATHCNTLQHTATHCNTLQHTAAHCNTLTKTVLCSLPVRHCRIRHRRICHYIYTVLLHYLITVLLIYSRCEGSVVLQRWFFTCCLYATTIYATAVYATVLCATTFILYYLITVLLNSFLYYLITVGVKAVAYNKDGLLLAAGLVDGTVVILETKKLNIITQRRTREVALTVRCCSVLQCVAVCCSVLQCVAVCVHTRRTAIHNTLQYTTCCV